MCKHLAVYISNKENKKQLINAFLLGKLLPELNLRKGAVFSDITINKFIEEETRHGNISIQTQTNNSLRNSSEGERKQALLNHILSGNIPEYLILDNIFDGMDVEAQSGFTNQLKNLSRKVQIIQITTRKREVLPFIAAIYTTKNGELKPYKSFKRKSISNTPYFVKDLPPPYRVEFKKCTPLISLKSLNVSYQNRPILKDINWDINPNEFWQLIGPNGSGKSTMLSLISGDNPKGYGQNIKLFGYKKGSGETVWDIKKNIGFYSSEMLRGFKHRASIEHMIVSGFLDSIGLYKYPTDIHLKIASQWLELLNMSHIKTKSFHLLSNGHKRLVLIARAMVKHPPLLILDEPTNGLDDDDARIFAELINKIALESKTAIIYVSHRKEAYIKPHKIYQLIPTATGSIGKIV